ncbi:unnamed protein product [Didymodactylos carnosus]|uniref:TraB domain-containing protein n=1 Tax=Didymodactylos carnosus TaxID=1234261 RepID=A0A813UPM3_9BILA|nr:unnamed protein product [Didymodactylos carnosus]CAF0832834.1 unnamed protein product [Didymodactylos carnosus]CAF3596738.1 unnamed protein product [Didymodactylos carnosus]CAF3619908.1 unnamed protein product [Didymodactylos carnosus]
METYIPDGETVEKQNEEQQQTASLSTSTTKPQPTTLRTTFESVKPPTVIRSVPIASSRSIYSLLPKPRSIPIRVENPQLPETVTVLKDPNTNGTIYLIGTAHFSEKSQRDVAEVIQLTQPDIVMVELCKSRVNVLSLDEQTLMKEATEMNLQKLRALIKSVCLLVDFLLQLVDLETLFFYLQNGVIHGVIHVLLLSMTAHLTKELGMAPGGEFRAAFREAKKIPNCGIILGDRPVTITLKRAINSLTWWKKVKLAWSLCTSKEKITSEDVEKCMQQDMLERLLLEMSGDYPELSRVFVEERDQFLAYSLKKCAQPIPIETTADGFVPSTVVGVVGIGHVPGIVKNWDKNLDVSQLMSIDPSSSSTLSVKTSSAVMKRDYGSMALKVACFGAIFAAIFHFAKIRLR